MRRFFLPMMLLSLAGPCVLAQLKVSAATPSDPYAAEPFVIDRMESVYRMQADGTGVHEKTVVAEVQSESALKEIAVLSVGFAANSEHAEWVYARLHHKDGTTTETPVANAMEQAEAVTRSAPFYSDLKELQLPLRDLRVGDQLEWKFRVTKTKAEAAGQFWGQEAFSTSGVVLSEVLVLDVPKDISVNAWSPKVKPVETVAGDRRMLRWSTESKKRTVGPEADAFKESEKKRVRTDIEELETREGKLPDVAWTTFKSWEAVGAWYRGLEGERMQPDAEVKARVAQLTAGKTTEAEKVQAVYAYVATQIHYIGVAFGVGRYQPHSAGDVLQNQYGDCKDKHTLLAAMLVALGLHPDAVLIGAGIRFNEAVPSPAAFNHLITHLELDGKPVWLDTTAEVAPFGMLIYVTRDHSALVIPDKGVARVEKTPKDPPFSPVDTMEAKGTLDADGVSTSRLTLTFHGDNENLVRSVLRQVSPAQYDLLAQQMCASMGYGGTASHMEVGRADDTSEPIKVSFDYKRVKAGDWDNLQTIPQLAPVTLPHPDEKEPPIASIPLGPPHLETSHAEMKLPEGWTAELPEAVHAKSEWASYDETYRFEKGTVYADRRVQLFKDRVAQADWKAYNKFLEKANVGSEFYVQLVRKPGSGPVRVSSGTKGTGEESGSAKPSNAEAAKLIDDAYTALQNHDPATAAPLLDKAKALNPEQRRLWGNYGDLAMVHGEISTAVEDYKKELALHPSAFNVYPVLVRTLVSLGRRTDAVETLKKWSASDPQNPAPLMTLAGLELEDGDAAKAVATATSAMALTPEGKEPNPGLMLFLGRAQLKAGMKDKGHDTLLALATKTDDPNMMNDAAYELADAGLELPLADKTTRTALDTMEEESQAWTLDENLKTLRAKTQLLQATWDTMGWIAFREGKVDVAEGYVKASWLGRQSTEVGMHLGEIDLSKGQKAAALTLYDLAIATVAPYDDLGVRREPTGIQKDLITRAAALRKAGVKGTSNDAKADLQKLRVYPLGPGHNGVAEYKLLVNAEGLLRAEPTGEKDLPDALVKLKLAKLNGLLPPGSKAHIVVSGMLNCHSGACELVLFP